MNTQKDIKPISYIRSNTAEVLDYINKSHNTMFITQKGEVKGVLTDPVSFQETQDALNILRIVAQSDKNYLDGDYEEQGKFFKKFEIKNSIK
jgi:PHD/YefM family antitoxin component YafN of YafNO toxin-antitoxin module